MGIKIDGLDNLKKKLSNPQGLVSEMIDNKGGVEIKCPNCDKLVKVPTSGTTCSCGQKIDFTFKS